MIQNEVVATGIQICFDGYSMKLRLFQPAYSSQTLGIQGVVSFVFLALVSSAILVSSLFSAFVPRVFAAAVLQVNNVPSGDIYSTCGDNGGLFTVQVVVSDDDSAYVNDGATFTAEYQIDEGGWTLMTQDNAWDDGTYGYAEFHSDLTCDDYQDQAEHTLEIRGTTPSGTYTDPTLHTFSVGPTGSPNIQNELSGEVGNRVCIDSGLDLEVFGTAQVASGFEIDLVQYEFNGGGYANTNGGGSGETVNYDFNEGSQSDGDYDLNIKVHEFYTNTEEVFNYTVGMGTGGCVPTPEVTVDNETSGTITIDSEPKEVTGNATIDGDTIDNVTYIIDGGSEETADGTFGSDSVSFTLPVDSLDNGTYDLDIRAYYDSTYSEFSYTLEIDIPPPADSEAPTCGTTWYNLESPQHTDTFTYNDIVCTDNTGVTSAQWRIYHNVNGELALEDIVTPTEGSYGDTEVGLGFTAEIPAGPNQDGGLSVELIVKDAANNTVTYKDPLVVEYEDQTPPTISLQLINPDPVADLTPTITGSCRDAAYRELNTNIASIEYQVDGGGYDSLDALDGNYNSTNERFAHTLDELSEASHTVMVRCTDGAGNQSTRSQTFSTIELPPDAEASAATHVEDFTTSNFQDIANTTLVWGNGQLRLKEDIEISRSAVDTTGYRDRYQNPDDNAIYKIIDSSIENTAWYVKQNGLGRLNTSNDTVQAINPADYGLSDFNDINDIEEIVVSGKTYLIVGDENGLAIFNITDDTAARTNTNGGVVDIAPDTGRGRNGLYLVTTTGSTPGGSMQLAYRNLGSTIENFGDDSFTRVPTNSSGMSGTDVVRIFDSPVANEYIVSVYNTALFRWNDNNTPTNFADDDSTAVEADDDDFSSVFAVAFAPGGEMFVGTAGQENGELFVVTDDNGTAYDGTDDTVVQIAEDEDLGYNDVFGLMYLEGVDGVGDQLLVETESGNPVYLNFNSTLDYINDDTYIELVTNNGIRPSTTALYLADYNTFYANIDRQGLFKIEVNRGWEDSGSAVALPPRPPESPYINKFVAEVDEIDTIDIAQGESDSSSDLAFAKSWFPQVMAQGGPQVTYEISLDDGVTWEPITLGELQSMTEEDYRLQFRITMEESGSSTPVIHQYTLEYGGYPDPSEIGQVNSFQVSSNKSNLATGETFTLTVRAVDVLGILVPNYSGNVPVQLLKTSDSSVTSGLNISSISVVNGTGTATGTNITQAGSFTVKADNGSANGQSGTLTVSGGSQSNPNFTQTLTSNDYWVCPDQTFRLSWSSVGIDSATLNGENVSINSSREFRITQTTDYVLRGTGPLGTLQSHVQVTVDPNTTTCSTTNPVVQPVTFQELTSNGPTSSSLDNPGLTSAGGSESANQANSDSDTNSGGAGTDQPQLEIQGGGVYLPGELITISWDAPDADFVTVDYLGGEVGRSGSFQIRAAEGQNLTIIVTAYKDGRKSVTTREVKVQVPRLPLGLGRIVPPRFLPILAAVIRYGALIWVLLMILIKILMFFKRKPDGTYDSSFMSRFLYHFQALLWVLSPLLLILSLLAAGMLGTPWFQIISICVGIVVLRHAVTWVRSWSKKPVDPFKKQTVLKPLK